MAEKLRVTLVKRFSVAASPCYETTATDQAFDCEQLCVAPRGGKAQYV